jgi:HlyD family secretion protein
MSYLSSDSSSTLTKDEQNQDAKNQQVSQLETEKNQQILEENNHDLHYATKDLLDGLPKLWSHGILYVLIVFTIIGIPWATLSKVDETGSARGRIEPQGATQKLDSEASGSIKLVKVKEGDFVEAGQVLLELNTDVLKTELEQTKTKLSGLLNQQSQLDLLKEKIKLSLNTLEQQNQSQALEKLSQVNQAKQTLQVKENVYHLQKLEQQALVNRVKQQIAAAENDRESAKIRLEIDEKQVKRFSTLLKDGAVSTTQVDELIKQEQESKRIYENTKYEVKQAKLRLIEEENRYQAKISQLQADIKQAKLRLQEAESSYQSVLQAGKLAVLKNQEQIKDIEAKISNLETEIERTNSQIASLNIQLEQRIVRSPIDGIIFELPFTKPGAVVQPGQRIAQIAPQNAQLILNAKMPSQDSGFLKIGMPVKVKFDAYPFQEYGIVPGKVVWISPDSKVQQTPQGNIESYELEITLEQQYVENGDQRILLTAGQTANAEVIIRQRRIIDLVLDPFKKLQKNGLEL